MKKDKRRIIRREGSRGDVGEKKDFEKMQKRKTKQKKKWREKKVNKIE